jgi:hypothetical protein
MKNYLCIFLLPFFVNAQDKPASTIVYPKGNWYFGIEAGTNKVVSNEFSQPTHFQAGLTAEYYFAKQWSVQGKIKYFATEVAYDYPQTILTNGATPYTALSFKGEVVSVPVDIKWEFRLYKNLKGFMSLGLGYNIETQSDYEIPGHPNPDVSMFPANYVSAHGTVGLNYFVSAKWAVYASLEFNGGGQKGHLDGFWGDSNLGSENSLANLGVKYHFKD